MRKRQKSKIKQIKTLILLALSRGIYIYFFFSYFEKNNENIGPPSTGHGHVKL
jgi:hypothetical protein